MKIEHQRERGARETDEARPHFQSVRVFHLVQVFRVLSQLDFVH